VVIVRASLPDSGPFTTPLVAIVLFLSAHFALLIGVNTPDKFVFDEVHYVPAARQMLEPVMSAPLLNPMHPPLAKQLISLSIRSFGDDRSAGAIQPCCSDRLRSSRCISAVLPCSARRGLRSRRR
jgi:hypothetical protein